MHLVYWLSFFWINRRKNIYNNEARSSRLSANLHSSFHKEVAETTQKPINRADGNLHFDDEMNGAPSLQKNPSQEELPKEELAKEEEEDVNKNHQLNLKTISIVAKKIWFYCANLGLVFSYFPP